jgi:sulfite reductase (ferredoxin)
MGSRDGFPGSRIPQAGCFLSRPAVAMFATCRADVLGEEGGAMAGPSDSKLEHIKINSNQLAGTIAEELADDDVAAFSADNAQLLKFHGIYAQDNRDVRRERKRQKLDLDHICMVRVAIPGGVLTAEQYLVLDKLSDTVGDGTLRITTRQGIQYHFVHKGDLEALLSTLNSHLVTTLGACGDVVRNTMCCPAPLPDRTRADVEPYVNEVAAHFRPRTRAYYQLWIDGDRAVTADAPGEEPVYGAAYLPRKFKIGFAFPGDNCVDVHTHDIGIVPVLHDDASLRAFTVLVGGGLGKNHTNPDTFPRLADPLTTIAPDELLAVLDAIVATQRDHGDRANRDHARMKYLVHDLGIDAFAALVQDRLGHPLPTPEPLSITNVEDHLGWHRQDNGIWFLGVHVDNGRIVDHDHAELRSGLRAAVERFTPGIRLTPAGDILLTDLHGQDRAKIDQLLADHGITPVEQLVGIRRNAFACPALPTCGLALTESERAIPAVLDELQNTLGEFGLVDLDTHIRMTGCPNGCSRPYTAEIGLVGRGKTSYDIHIGGDPAGTRLNQIFTENVPRHELVNALRPLLLDYRDHRHAEERLGDYCHRVGIPSLRARLGTERWTRRPRTQRNRR